MTHDFNKPSHVQTPEERQKKKRVPLYILALVGIFLIALLFYMFADTKPNLPLQQQVTKRQPTIAIRRLQLTAKCD